MKYKHTYLVFAIVNEFFSIERKISIKIVVSRNTHAVQLYLHFNTQGSTLKITPCTLRRLGKSRSLRCNIRNGDGPNTGEFHVHL